MNRGTQHQYISATPPSRLSRVTLAQAELVADAIRNFCGVLPRVFGVQTLAQLDLGAHARISGLREYAHLIRALHAGGFVLRDAPPDFPLERAHQHPGRLLGACGLPGLRRYLHTLVHAERAADGGASPLLAAAKSGALRLVAVRLGADASLRPPPPRETATDAYQDSWDIDVFASPSRGV